jgi:hypothetical protein
MTEHFAALSDLARLPIWAARGCPDDHEDDRGQRVRDSKGGPYARRAPIDPETGAPARSNAPKTWGTRGEAEARVARFPARLAHDAGVGLFLGPDHAPDGLLRAGLDLDGCRDPETGDLAPWAESIVWRLGTYAEASPSRTGLHLLFLARAGDLDTLRAEGLVTNLGRNFSRGDHLEIAAFFGGKFLTVTDEVHSDLVGDYATLRLVDLDALRWLLGDYAPAWAAEAGGPLEASGKDESGSGAAFRLALDLAREGLSADEIAEGLADDDGEAGAWWSRVDERQHARCVARALERVETTAAALVAAFDDLPDDEEDLVGTLPESAGSPPVSGAERAVMRRKNGEPDQTAHNAIIYLTRADRKQGLGIRHNRFSGRDEWKAGEIRDADLTMIRVEIERAGMRNVGADLTARAVRAVAERNAVHPVRDWLSGLTHDGAPRLSSWLSTYLGAEDSPYVRAVGRATLVGLVARAMRPGCKHDHVLCLIGAQGAGKSTACRVLGGEWYGDNLPPLARDDVEPSRWLRGHWLIEISELAPTRKAEAETLKSFLSRAADEVRQPFARLAEAVPRQCAFVATTNDPEFLRDPTGGRRFWPVVVGESVDLDGLARDRDQLFAEALAAFKAGEAWHLSPEMETAARERQSAATEEDPWTESVAAFLAGTSDPRDFADEGDEPEPQPRAETTTAEVLAALGLPPAQQGGTSAKRVGAIMRGLGWEYVKHARKRFWRRVEA